MRTLWRGDKCLGQLVVAIPARRGIAGMLVPTPELQSMVPLMQVRMRALPGEPVFQTRIDRRAEPATAGPRRLAKIVALRTTQHAPSGSVHYSLRPIEETEAQGVPRASVLELREDGVALEVEVLLIDRFDLPPADVASTDVASRIHAACTSAGVEPSGWMVAAFPAPA